MKVLPTALHGVYILEPQRHGDSRGYFSETYRADVLDAAVGYPVLFVQDNESLSRRGVVRGLHYQAGSDAQAKLVRVSEGTIVDVVVDLRRSSPTYGKHLCVELSAENGLEIFIPRGMAHGFAVISDVARFQYKVDNYWSRDAERTLQYDDPALGIDWPIPAGQRLLSPKDTLGTPWLECEKFD